ncbi:MAG: hypothetical protein ACQESS_03220 [Bacillota bacterium]
MIFKSEYVDFGQVVSRNIAAVMMTGKLFSVVVVIRLLEIQTNLLSFEKMRWENVN